MTAFEENNCSLKVSLTYVHTYIISVRNIDLVSHTPHVSVNFIHKWRDLQLLINAERKIFWETFHGNFIFYSQSICKKSAEKKLLKGCFLYFIFMCGLGLLDYGSNNKHYKNKYKHSLDFLLCHIKCKAKQSSELMRISQSCVKMWCVLRDKSWFEFLHYKDLLNN